MATTTIHVSKKSHALLNKMAREQKKSLQLIVDQALELYRRQQILEDANNAYAAMRANKEAWQDFRQELSEWDYTLNDGLEE